MLSAFVCFMCQVLGTRAKMNAGTQHPYEILPYYSLLITR